MNVEAPENVNVVVATVAPNEVIADIWRQVLEDEGIVVAIKPGDAGHSFGTNALNRQYLLVRADQLDLAREILDELIAEEDIDEDASSS